MSIYQSLLGSCPNNISTEGMTNEEWLEKRRCAIGGSDAGAIMGMSSFGSPLTVYLQKKNLVPNNESRAAHRGKLLEKYIREDMQKGFEKELEIEAIPYMFFNQQNPFMLANIDGVILVKKPIEIRGETIEGFGGHEIKSAKTNYGWSDDEIPDSYFAQVQHYMAVLDLPWFVVSVYILEDESLNHYVIRRNEDFIARLISAEKDFWENNIEKNTMPAPLGLENEEDMITGMFEGSARTISLSEDQIPLCSEYVELNKSIKEMEARKKVLAIQLKEIIVNSAEKNPDELKASAKAGNFSISWSRFNRRDVDSDALKRDGLYDKYAKVSESGRFTVTQKKEG